MSKGITYDAILSLSLEDIAQSFPHGAREVTKGRFEPADEGGATKTLDELLKAKKARQEKPSYLRASYSIPSSYVRNPNARPRPGENDNYTFDRAKALGGANEPEERVPADFQKRLTAEAHLRDAEREPPLHERLRRLEEHAEPHQLESLKRRISGLERSLHDKAA